MERYVSYLIVLKLALVGLLIWLGATLVNCANSIPMRHLQ